MLVIRSQYQTIEDLNRGLKHHQDAPTPISASLSWCLLYSPKSIGRTLVVLARVTGTSLHQSARAEMKHGDGTRLGQLAILQPMIVAREVKTYKQKPAPIWATWPGQEEGERRRGEFGLPKEEEVE